ncbi:MAG TPA: SMI1/KNR4 family protein [Chitinophaga sp.]
MKLTITDIISKLQEEKAALGITLYDKASEEEIKSFERGTGIELTADFKTFYRFCNGFESGEDMFRMLPLDEIQEDLRKDRNDGYLVWQKDFHFAEYMLYCDMWTVSINNAQQNNYTIYNHGERVLMLTTDLAEFLEIFLKGGVFDGLYNWMDEIKNNAK